MILNDKTARFITKSPLIPLAMLLFGSVWFALSVLAVVVAVILPFTKRKPPPKAQASSNTIVFIPSDAPVPLGSFPSKTEIRIPQEGTYHVSFANHTGSMQHGTGRVGPPMLTVIPPLSGSITITTTPDSADVSLVSAPPPLASPPLPVVSEDDDERLVASPEVAPDDATLVGEEGSVAPVIPLVRRSTLGMRLPTIFRRKPSKSSGAPTSSRPSSPCSPSPPSLHCNFVDLKSDSECEARPPLRRKKNQRTVDDVETFRTTFVNPLRLKNRRAHSSSVSSAPVEATSLPPSPTPPPSAFTSHRRNRSLASYINLSVRSNSPSRSASPHRGSFSSCSTASSSPGPNSTSRRSFSFSSSQASSERDVRRTQPYGAPYYAAMPVPKPRRSLDSQAGAPKASPRTRNWDGQVEVEAGRRHKQDATDASAYSSAVEEDGNALGLSLGETVPHQRHREIWGGAGAVR